MFIRYLFYCYFLIIIIIPISDFLDRLTNPPETEMLLMKMSPSETAHPNYKGKRQLTRLSKLKVFPGTKYISIG